MDGTSKGVMSDTTLTLTALVAGSFVIKLTKDNYISHSTTINVKRYGE